MCLVLTGLFCQLIFVCVCVCAFCLFIIPLIKSGEEF
uniref:Uncharacterized protein n=1 Tax=Anguilla anguilla TaxID=7936 RepID=A0A0E9TP43_ANGAN